MAGGDGDFLQSLERGLSVIRAFSGHAPTATISDIATRTGLPRATARRILLTLQQLGYVRSEDRLFALTPRVLEIGSAYLSSLLLPDTAAPHIRAMTAKLLESSSVAILDGTEIVYVARAPTRRIMTIALTIGSRLPAYCTSMGRVLLAHLPAAEIDHYFDSVDIRPLTSRTIVDEGRLRKILANVRSKGWALVDQELEDGVRSIAAPIHRRGQVIAALNVSAHAGRTSLDATKTRFLPELLECAARISNELVETPSTISTMPRGGRAAGAP